MSELRRRVPPSWSLGFLLALLACGSPRAVPLPLDRTSHEVREVRLVPGASHAYRIFLEAGEYLALRIDQPSVDVVVSFYDPEGRKLLGIDNWSGADGMGAVETVRWVAETAGEFRVEIRAANRIRTGLYTLRLEELRPASARDLRRVAAERAFSEGDVLFGPATTRRQALAEYRKALEELRGLEDRNRQADALFRLAYTHDKLGEDDNAARLYSEAIELYETVGHGRQQALCLQMRSLVSAGRYELEATLADLERALPLWESSGDRRGRATTLNDMGATLKNLGQTDEALAAYHAALELWQEIVDPLMEARTLHNLSQVYALLGRDRQAVAGFEEALEVRRRLGSPTDVANSLMALGQAHLRLREPERALGCFRQVLAGLPEGKVHTVALALSGQSQVELGAVGEGTADLLSALDLFQARGEKLMEAWTLNALGRTATLRGKYAEARTDLDAAHVIYKEIRDRAGLATVLRNLAELERRRGDPESALALIEAALDQVEDLRARVSSSGTEGNYLPAEFFATRQSYYDLYVDLLAELGGEDAAALEASERARARSLVELLSRASLSVPESRLFELERDLERKINATELRLTRVAAQSRSPRLLEQQAELMHHYEEVRAEIRSSSPRYAALTRPETLTADEIRNLLDPETLLLEYKLGDARSYLWAVTRESIRCFHLPPRDEIEGAARRAYEMISANRRQSRERVEMVLDELGEVLLGPLPADQLEGRQRLVIVADGALHFLPFAALTLPRTPHTPLAARHELVGLPSASTLKALRDQAAGRRRPAGTLAIVADPVFGPDDPRVRAPIVGRPPAPAYPRLEHSGTEAAALGGLAPAGQRLDAVGFAASRDVVSSGALGRFRLLHLATHAEIDTESPEQSHLVLTRVDEHGLPRGDGLLFARDVYGLELAADLVVLSSCRTALGKPIRGEGLVGWTRGFMYAGSPRVVVSLWNVDDESTAKLMTHFYYELLARGSSPPAALRAAQLRVRSDPRWRSAFHWAGFVLQGEWRDIFRP